MNIDYSALRKASQKLGDTPEWITTGGYQLILEKGYISPDETIKERYTIIASTLAKHLPAGIKETYRRRFFDLLWQGKLSPSTPALTNIGKPLQGLPIACSGSYVIDSIAGFYSVAKEIALLSKAGFGTSAYLGDIRPRGTNISTGGQADGIVPVMDLLFSVARHVSQGSQRRGSIACYVPISHPDFWEVVHFIENNPDGSNLGWTISNADIQLLIEEDPELVKRYSEVLYLRMLGKGYLHMIDKANEFNPIEYAQNGLSIKASNLCSEIMLHSSEDMTYTCCLSSLNLANWSDNENENKQTVKDSITFLDCVNSEFIMLAKGKEGFEKSVRFAEYSRPVGLGVMGLSTLFQSKSIQFDGLDGQFASKTIAKNIRSYAEEANLELGTLLGSPELMKESGKRCSHLLAIAPTMSTALIMGGVSNGIEPNFANIFTQETAGGEIRRANPILVKLMKEKGIWNKEIIQSIISHSGSINHLDAFSQREKDIFKTAFECDQYALIRMNDQRSQYVDQGVSFNLFIPANANESYIADLHQEAISSKYIKSLYYVRSSAGFNARTDLTECVSCEG